MQKKLFFMNRLIKAAVISMLMIFGLGILIFPFRFHSLLNACFIEDDYTLRLALVNDAVKEGNKYSITGEDAYLVFDAGEEYKLLNGKLYLNHSVEKDTDIQVFYADSDSGFREENSYYTSIKKGRDSLIFELPFDKTRYVRIDIIEDAGYSFTVGKMTAAAPGWTAYWKLYAGYDNLKSSLMIYLGIVFLYLIKKNWNALYRFLCRHEYAAAVLLLSACMTILYYPYLSGEYFYIFTDIGSDSYNQTYPYLINTARRIAHGLWKEFFNFTEGLGNPNSSLVLGLDNWIAVFGEHKIAYLMGFSQWLKVILTGVFAYHFSRIYGNGHKLSIAAAFCYACNAFVMIRGSWNSYPNQALLLIIWLTAYEYYHTKKGGYLLPAATVLFFCGGDVYDCVFWGAALSCYIAFRELSEGPQMTKAFFVQLCRKEMLYWCSAFFGMADTVINNLSKTLQSHRFSENTDSFIETMKDNIFSDSGELITAFLRTVGAAVCGVSDYAGSFNFLEDAAFYCGILFFILIPLAVFQMESGKKKYYICGYAAAGIYLLLRPVRFILNGFAAFTYKLSSLWIIALMFLTCLSLFKFCFTENGKFRKKSAAVFHVTLTAAILCMLVSLQLGYAARLKNWFFSFACLIGYGIIIHLMLFHKISRKAAADVLCACVIVETLFISWDCVNGRRVVSRRDYENGMLYNNAAKEAVDDLLSADAGWYRIEKRDGAVSLCESLAQNYYGTMSYVGGTGIGSGTLDYYFDLELPHSGDHYLYGTGGDVYTGAMLGIKYYMTKSGQKPYMYGLKYAKTVHDVDIYENTLALPLAYAYDSAVPYDAFGQFSGTEKRRVLLEDCAVDNTDGSFSYKKDAYMGERCRMYPYEPAQVDGKYYLDLPQNSVLVIKLKTAVDELWNLYYENEGQTVYAPCYSFDEGEENTIEIYADDLDAVWFGSHDAISDVQFYYQDADAYYASVKAAVEKLKKNALQMESYRESSSLLEGQIECDREMILATSIPYDENWQVFVDGKQADAMKVNIGFVGAELSAGLHKVVLRYDSDSWIFDNKYKCIGFLAAACIAVYGIRKRKRMPAESRL